MRVLPALAVVSSTLLAPPVRTSQAPAIPPSCVTTAASVDAETYLGFVTVVARSYRQVRFHQQLLARCPALSFTDVTNDPTYAAMEAADTLAPGFERRVYEFLVSNRERGVVDVVFKGSELVNVRAQFFFEGPDGVARARAFALSRLPPLLQSLFGDARYQVNGSPLYLAEGVAAFARHVPGTPSVSVWVMDDRYL